MNKILCLSDNNTYLDQIKPIILKAFPNIQVMGLPDHANDVPFICNQCPDILLIDADMKRADCCEICKTIKHTSQTCHIPVVFLASKENGWENPEKMLDIGCDAVLKKPVDEVNLILQMKAMLQINQLNQHKQKEARYREMLNIQHDMICRFSPEGNITYANESFARFRGKPSEHLLGDSYFSQFSKKELDALKSLLTLLTPDKTTLKQKNRIKDVKGDLRWQEWCYVACFDNRNEVIEYQSVGRDIADQIQTEQKLLESKSHFKTLFNLMVDPVVIVDKRGKFLEITDRMEEITGFKKKDFIGKNFMGVKIATAQSKALLLKNLAKRMMGVKVHPYEVDILTKDGRALPFEVNAVKIDYMGKSVDMVAFRDVGARNKAEQEKIALTHEFKHTIKALESHVFRVKRNQDNEYVMTLSEGKIAEKFHLTTDEIGGKALGVIFGPSKLSQIKPYYDRAFAGETISFEIELTKGWFSCTLSPFVKDDNQLVTEIIGCTNDINERKQTEKELKASEAKNSAVLKALPDLIFVHSEDGTFLDYHAGDTSALYLAPEEFLGKKAGDIFPGVLADEITQMIRKAIKTQGIQFIEYQLPIAGQTRHYEARLVPYGMDKVLSIIRDITLRKKAEEEVHIQKAYLDRLFQSAPEAICILDNEDRLQQINREFTRLFGYTSKEAIGNRINDLIVPEHLKSEGENATKDVTSGKAIRIETVRNDKHGNEINVSVLGRPIILEGNQLAVFGIFRDITERKKAEEKLRESEERYRAFFKSTRDCVYISSKEGKWLDLNNAAVKLFGYKNKKELLKVNVAELYYHPDDRARFMNTIDKKGFVKELPFDLLKKDGSLIHALITSVPVKNNNNDIVAYQGIIRDITAQKNAEKELIKAKELAEESDRLKSAFLANMSHEIRTPMNGILGFADLLKEPNVSDEEQIQYIEIIENSGLRMLNTLNDLIKISKIEAGQDEVVLSEVNIFKQLEYLHSFFKPEAEKKGLSLLLNISLSEGEGVIKTDRSKFNSILTNLVKNAVKYTLKGFIEFGCRKKGDYLEFFVKDTGIGIPDEKQKMVFDRFVQAENDESRAFEGAGLGLSITKAYVEMLGGKIWVESTANAGSQFFFCLPVGLILSDSGFFEKRENIIKGNRQTRKLNILIAEDEQSAAKMLDIVLQPVSKKIFHAGNGAQAVEICKQDPTIDLILMDVRMPVMDGYKATGLIREFNKDVIIIAQTAYALEGDREKALNAGCNDYIAKPIKRESLRKLIDQYLGQVL